MRPNRSLMTALALPLAALLSSDGAAAQESAPANPHIVHVAQEFRATPESAGLLPTAIAEAQVAARHAELALRDVADLDAMKRHAGHVLHAIDPTQMAEGPGKGYGLKKAADQVAQHIELAAKAEGAPQGVVTHSVHIATSARNTAARADEVAALAKQVQAATTAEEAAALLEQLNAKAAVLLPGLDANSDGRVGWQEGEGGLDTAQTHLELMHGAMH